MPPRKEPVLIERRTISGRGVFIFAPDVKWRHFWLYVSILRPPLVDFGSSQYNPDRSFYATFTWSHRNYILREDVLRYYQQCFQWSSDPTGYIAKAEICLHNRTIDYLRSLGQGLNVPLPAPDPNNRIWYEPLQDRFDRIRISCRDRTAITAELWGVEYDVACPDATPTPKPPPSPDLPPPSVPPTTNLDNTDTPVSPPYPENDGGDTAPLPGDEETTPPTTGTDCLPYRVRILAGTNAQPSIFTNVDVWGRIGQVRVNPASPSSVQLECRNRRIEGACANFPFGYYQVLTRGAPVTNGPTIISITPQ